MKTTVMLAFLLMSLSGIAVAEEANTDCPKMAESNERRNPKADMSKIKVSAEVKTVTSKQ